jgi:hypothetical protein
MRNLLSRVKLLLMLLAVAHATCPSAQTTTAPSDSHDTDAAIARAVAGIISYTHWPTPLSTVRLCVVGDARDWSSATSTSALPSTPPISVTASAPSADTLVGSCDALYIGAMTDTDRRALFQRIAGHPLLTIAEQDRSCTSGAMFCISASHSHVSFDVNIDSVSRSGVRVSPSVLELARKLNTP